MNNKRNTRLHVLCIWSFAVCGMLIGPNTFAVTQQPRDPAAAESGQEVLTRGPVHEAFAAPVVFDAKPGIVAPKQPPNAIEELPPEQKPEGDNVTWIAGYWSWDDERKDFLWVSGIWRQIPPGHQWVPGYWNKTDQGYQWISGFWSVAATQEIEYLPAPPESLEAGPSSDAPSADYFWAPGCWVWQESRYAWRPGHWVLFRPDWLWVPAHYAWTPRGYVFVEGYWDYSIARRGLLFAPVYFDRAILARRDFRYSPRIVIAWNVLTDFLFSRPVYHQYFFGDYYDPSYFQAGIYPWFAFHNSRYGYDPIYAYYASFNGRRDSGWDERLRADFRYRREHDDARPARTFAAQGAVVRGGPDQNNQRLLLAQPLASLTSAKDPAIRLEKLNEDRRAEIGRQAKDIHQFRDQRLRLETGPKVIIEGKAQGPYKLALPQSPITSKPIQVQKGGPPAIPSLPKPDVKIQPKTPGADHPRPEPRVDHKPPPKDKKPKKDK